ncbi:MAG: phage tail protein, partial [Tumebacillaceae bacterium]
AKGHSDQQGELLGQLSLLLPSAPSGLAVDENGSIYLSDSRDVAPDGEDTRFVMQYDAQMAFVANVAGYRGKTDRLLITKNRMYIWNAAEQMVSVLELKPRTKLLPQTGRYEGMMLFRALDSTVNETIWHKITLDADFPDETQLRVSYYASDRRDAFINGQYVVLDEYISDPDRSMQEKLTGLARFWSDPIVSPHDALFFEAQGRYLWLKIEMVGSEKISPLVRKLRAFFPRTSYLENLPAVYQEDPASRDFLERFLSLFGTFMNEMENKIAHISRYFDGDSVSGEYLRWLATWLGIASDGTWTEEQTQSVLKRAPELYKKRGTREGLELMIEIFTGEKPYLVEFFQYKHLIEKSEIKKYMEQLYGLDPYCFCVLVKPESVPTENHRLLVQRILDEEKPAFAEAKLVVLEPWMYLGTHSYIGVNTFMSEPSLLVLDDKSSMPYQTLLIDVDRDHRIGLHTRMEMDSELE